jgi:2-polyprenyl-3-methyl-5-hydroxy-6-metoxy-1,4-benzoquinol methylase
MTTPERNMETVNCNLCGGDSAEPYLELNGLTIRKCPGCGLLYVNPRPSPEALKELYTAEYFSNQDNCFKGRYFGYVDYAGNRGEITDSFRPRLERIEAVLDGRRGRLLDIGCALGYFLHLAAQNGWQVYGTDVSAAAAASAAGVPGASVFCGPVEAAGFAPGSFDAVTMWDVIEHLPDPAATVRHANKLLKPGGVFALVTPDAGSLAARLLRSRWPEFRRIEEHIYFFSRGTLAALLKKHGFEVVRVEGAGRIFDVTSIINEMKIYNFKFFGALSSLSERLGLSNLKIYVKPGYKLAMYARKIKEI